MTKSHAYPKHPAHLLRPSTKKRKPWGRNAWLSKDKRVTELEACRAYVRAICLPQGGAS